MYSGLALSVLQRPDLIILDSQLPDMPGETVLRELRLRPSTRRTPIIMVTGVAAEERRIAGLMGGASDYIVKPVVLPELIARVDAHLRTQRAWTDAVQEARSGRARESRTFRTFKAEIRRVIDDSAFTPHFQPIIDMPTSSIVAYEALTRFSDGVNPGERFLEARRAELEQELELVTMRAAIRAAGDLGGARLHLNASARLAGGDGGEGLQRVLSEARTAIVLELTEHEPVADYAALRATLNRVHPDIRIAVDDAGSGYASLRHILQLHPAYVKLDADWIRQIDVDTARQALIAGLVHFAGQTKTELIAEGIEHVPEARTLDRLGVRLAQGYLFGYPAPRA